MVQGLLQVMKHNIASINIAVIGLGYVGLPLAIALGKRFNTIGFDISAKKVSECSNRYDSNQEVSESEFILSTKLIFSSEASDISSANVIIIAVPTPVVEGNIPDFNPLKRASELVAKNILKGATIVFESTVYPGATEEICIPIIEKFSHLIWKRDFFIGYSPERINPGDKERTVEKITKVISGDSDRTTDLLEVVYGSIIQAGVFKAKSIKVAEAAKVIENTQRDLNISLMNELSIIFHILKIDTADVLEAAETKWNFLPFKPGLVGGHCIGVDPYYLTHKAEMMGYTPEVILAGRRINNSMPAFIAGEIAKLLIKKTKSIQGLKINILGLTFKEDCNDLRNSKIFDLIEELSDYGFQLIMHDPKIDYNSLEGANLNLKSWEDLEPADALILAVPHQFYLDLGVQNLTTKLSANGLFVDLKSKVDHAAVVAEDFEIWRL
jgi:UDP-N-acetyl-D-glucosamine/UDP-N-acetyl-D-galactosamine dehydrogenase